MLTDVLMKLGFRVMQPGDKLPLSGLPTKIKGTNGKHVVSNVPQECRFFGEKTGQTAECQTCRGRTSLFVFECGLHGSCTIGEAKGVKQCPCDDWQPRGES